MDDQPNQPAQKQVEQPGSEAAMDPQPIYIDPGYKGSGKLQDKIAIITGGDSWIGRAVAVHFAEEGADVVIAYLNETEDAQTTQRLVKERGRKCLSIAGDISDETFCHALIEQTVSEFGRLDVLVNNAAQQYPQDSILDITQQQLEQTFKVNIFSMFYTVQAALPHLKRGARIINTSSVTAYKGNETLIDYSATKGAIVAFTRSLSQQLIEQGIHVNSVAPGPIWTPLIPSTFDAEKVSQFGNQVPFKRPGQPSEVAPAYVFLASNDSSYMTGQILHVNGGVIVNG